MQDVRDAECRVACRANGYDDGTFLAPATCLCSDARDYEWVTRKRIVIPKKRVSQ